MSQDEPPDTYRPRAERTERRFRSSLRVIVNEVQLLHEGFAGRVENLFGTLVAEFKPVVRGIIRLRWSAHAQRSALAHMSAKLDTLLLEKGLPIPPPPSEDDIVRVVGEQWDDEWDEDERELRSGTAKHR